MRTAIWVALVLSLLTPAAAPGQTKRPHSRKAVKAIRFKGKAPRAKYRSHRVGRPPLPPY